jgi:hypothetical protein
MASHTQATPIPSVDNEPHHGDGEIVPNFPAFRWERMDRYAAAAHDHHHHHNNNLAIDEERERPRALGSPFRTPSPSSSRGSTTTKRSHDSMEDDDGGSTPVAARPHQRARHNDHSPTPPLQEDHGFHRERQAAALPPVRQQIPGIETAARQVLSLNGFLRQSGLDREALGRGVQVAAAAPPAHHHRRLRRATFDFAVPVPRGREHRRLPSPRPGPEHFPGELVAPPPPAGGPGYFVPRPLPPHHHHQLLRPLSPPALFPPAPGHVPGIVDPGAQPVGYYQQAGYYHLGQRLSQPAAAAPPPAGRPWLMWPDMSDEHRETWEAVEEWEDDAHDVMDRLDGMIERGRARIEGARG